MLRGSNAQLRLMRFDGPVRRPEMKEVPVQGPGLAHVCFQAARSTATHDRFLQNGARHVGAHEMVKLAAGRPVEYAYARDHDGIMFEVEHLDLEALNLKQPARYDRRIRHVSISTPDIDRSVEFYSLLLGESKPRRADRMSSPRIDEVSGLEDVEMSMAWFQVGNLELEIVQYWSHPTELPDTPRPIDAPGYNMIVLDVTDIDDARKRVLSSGGTIVSELDDMDGCPVLFARDRDGNLLGLQVVDPHSFLLSAQFEESIPKS